MKYKKALVVPLNWGFGHTTRMIPLISVLLQKGIDVIAGGSPAVKFILRQEFPDIGFIDFPYLKINYVRKNQILPLLLRFPAMIIQTIKEHRTLIRFVKSENIDIIFSDNCYGLWHKHVFCVFITHQLHIKIPKQIVFLEKFINRLNSSLIKKFDECWVPDLETDNGFAGELSHQTNLNIRVRYIGLLSRFMVPAMSTARKNTNRKTILFLISGPERQRTYFENAIRTQINSLSEDYEYCILRGIASELHEALPSGWYNHMHTHDLIAVIKHADYIICRSGYSTITDLIVLDKTAVLIPTPGQTEQEYLAEYMTSKGLFCTMQQSNFNLREAIHILDDQKSGTHKQLRHAGISHLEKKLSEFLSN